MYCERASPFLLSFFFPPSLTLSFLPRNFVRKKGLARRPCDTSSCQMISLNRDGSFSPPRRDFVHSVRDTCVESPRFRHSIPLLPLFLLLLLPLLQSSRRSFDPFFVSRSFSPFLLSRLFTTAPRNATLGYLFFFFFNSLKGILFDYRLTARRYRYRRW